MQLKCKWKNGMLLSASNGTHDVSMDGNKPFGQETQLSPKELVVAGLCGCTAMDVIGLMKKHKQPMESFEMDATVEMTNTGHPIIFSRIDLSFRFMGAIAPEVLLESVKLSQTKYCGVSAMLSKAVPIHYSANLNERDIGSGVAQFK